MFRYLMFLLLVAITGSVTLHGQEFMEGYMAFSKRKPAYVTMKDDTEIVGKIKGAKWKKGLMHTIKFITDGENDKDKISAEDIAFMYVAPSGLEKLGVSLNNATTINRWDQDLNADYFKDGYIYFEQVEAMVGKNKRTVLMQILNPHFSGDIKVYNDPFANETGGIGVAGMQVTGGRDKSYYVKKGDQVATKVKLKKQFKKSFAEYFGDCDAFTKTVDRPEWRDFATYVAAYNEACSKK